METGEESVCIVKYILIKVQENVKMTQNTAITEMAYT